VWYNEEMSEVKMVQLEMPLPSLQETEIESRPARPLTEAEERWAHRWDDFKRPAGGDLPDGAVEPVEVDEGSKYTEDDERKIDYLMDTGVAVGSQAIEQVLPPERLREVGFIEERQSAKNLQKNGLLETSAKDARFSMINPKRLEAADPIAEKEKAWANSLRLARQACELCDYSSSCKLKVDDRLPKKFLDYQKSTDFLHNLAKMKKITEATGIDLPCRELFIRS
jgi:hypothetical protein